MFANIPNQFTVAIYIRLSKEDDSLAESESVNNQKILLTNYINSQKYEIYDCYIDDGYTGTNFDRPAFQRMLGDIKLGKVNMVITKDLSRLSRDYIGTGEYVEKWFPTHNVRFVALTDNIDTFIETSNNDIAPFKAIINDMYAKDLSKKIRTALHTMQSCGKWVGGLTPYGYITDPYNKNHLIIHKTEGPIITKIFNLFNEGKKINQIRNQLNEENIPTFTVSRNRKFRGNDIYKLWSNITIKNILSNRLYTGDMIQNKRSRVSYKYRKTICNSPDKWIIVENTHEPLIDKETFKKVELMLPKQAQRNDKKEIFLLDGLLKCYECGANIGIRARSGKNKSAYTVCNKYRRYRKENKICTAHGNHYDKLEKLVIDTVRKILNKLNIDLISLGVEGKIKKINTFENIDKRINKYIHEINKNNKYLEKLYLDKLDNKIEDEFFNKIYDKIKNDISVFEKKIEELSDEKKQIVERKKNIKDTKDIIQSFLNLETPPRELMLKLINHISIHEDKTIDIHFNFKEPIFIYDINDA